MQLKSLEYLIELDKASSINKAAKHLYISQQGLRHALDTLESELGTPLFTRSKQGIELNEAGRVALVHAKAITQQYKTMQDELTQLRWRQSLEDEHARVELVVAPYASLTLVSTLLLESPGLASTVVHEWSKNRINDELHREMGEHVGAEHESAGAQMPRLFLYDWLSTDWLADYAPARPGSRRSRTQAGDELVVQTLFASRLGIICNPTLELASHASVTLDDLSGLTLACYSGEDYLWTIDAAFSSGTIADRALSVSDPATLLSYLERNERACLIADELSCSVGRLERGSEQFAFVPFRDAATISVGLAYVATPSRDDPREGLVAEVAGICSKQLA